MRFSSLILALPVAILLNYISLIPESTHTAHSFPVRIVTLWNRLQAATVLSGSLQSFIKSIEDINFIMLCLANISLCCMCF